MNINFNLAVTAEQKQQESLRLARATAIASRRSAYVVESDPLRFEADYDAMSQGREPDYAEWLASVEAIKTRFPLPVNADA